MYVVEAGLAHHRSGVDSQTTHLQPGHTHEPASQRNVGEGGGEDHLVHHD